MKNVIISIMLFLCGLSYGQDLFQTLVLMGVAEQAGEERAKAEQEEDTRKKTMLSNIEVLHMWDGQVYGRNCTCLERGVISFDSFGLPNFAYHRGTCPIHEWSDDSCGYTETCRAEELDGVLNSSTDEDKVVLVYRFKTNRDILYVKRVRFNKTLREPTTEAKVVLWTFILFFPGMALFLFIGDMVYIGWKKYTHPENFS